MTAAHINRRRLLLGGLGLGLVGVAGGAAAFPDPALRLGPGRTRTAVPAVANNTSPDTALVERVWSAARGMYVELVTMRPAGVTAAPLPVCLILHGRGGVARDYIPFGIPALLTGAVRAGAPPFAAVAVDCGRMYYMNEHGDDPMRMLVEEVPRWLEQRRHAAPTAVLGFSMGGWGALNLARRRPDLRAVALASPALFQKWSVAETRKAWVNERQWRDYEPLQHTDALGTTPIGLWCGTEDSFAGPAREFIRKAHPEYSSLTRGAHDGTYWHKVMPQIMRFVGSHLA